MPSSFSRFLDESELQKVRDLYLESLAALDAEDADDQPEDAAPQPVTSDQAADGGPGSAGVERGPAGPR